jgi:hypothetical protein
MIIIVEVDDARGKYSQRIIGTTVEEILLRATLPYGMWTTESGEEVLFNREYRPIWRRKLNEMPATPIKEFEWVEDIKSTKFFFDDSTSPFGKTATCKVSATAKKMRFNLSKVLDFFICNQPMPNYNTD